MRCDDSNPHCNRWTNKKLIREATRLAAKGPDWGCSFPADAKEHEWHYRSWYESWLSPVLAEITRRKFKATLSQDEQL